jgi:hypothetical protein
MSPREIADRSLGSAKSLGRVLRVYIRPREAVAELALDPRRYRLGWQAMLAMAALYTIVPVFLAILHGVPVPPPFLRIPADQYFYWASYFYLAALVAGWIFGSAVFHILARSLGGVASFEDCLALLGFATATATLPALVPDLAVTSVQMLGLLDYGVWRREVDTFLSPWFVLTWTYLVAYAVAFVVFYGAIARELHGLRGWRAWLTSLVGFTAYQGFILIFIR